MKNENSKSLHKFGNENFFKIILKNLLTFEKVVV